MERKLSEFRARKKAQTEAKEPADRVIQTETTAMSAGSPSVCTDTPEQKPNTCLQSPHTEDHNHHLLNATCGRWLQSVALTHLTLLKVLLWLVLLGLFSELEFGLPFFLISLFYWLYEGLRSPRARQPGEMSAYSVFNPDCQPILGTLTAEQLEGEMGYRPVVNR
ncbi:SAYSvFN domain-containing protein 1-like [Sinocyclocheilus grahami]|uniref:SAYSvFN domain-containing protein 1-like n=1 Tax=Sinocyclocheilus grahami TaxID=75366 RepID=A0A672MH82_SINGR|nr:PREDICTED: SAYSvFN domain-containing protein 1-like [Sinocyclocheilus grahami]XP_016086143.1 PREDICTED: SAYSvFN domain-containing protein 1-like [Sinocyclocheilus grahami]XP_016086144.1 PREDICTED: SAYSvFN domain-containing protein 1-like [Sinocyclocheilus grahami]